MERIWQAVIMDAASDSGNDNSRRAHDRKQAEAFDRAAHLFEQLLPPEVAHRLETIVDSAQIKAGDAVLDVGTGTGVLLPLILRAMPSRVVACDLSWGMLARATAKYGASVKFVQLDVADLPKEEGPFDVVFCNAMFGNVYDQRQALRAIGSLMGEGGRLVISHPMGKDFVRRLKGKSPGFDIKELPDENRLRSLLESEGLILTKFVDEPELYLAIAEKV